MAFDKHQVTQAYKNYNWSILENFLELDNFSPKAANSSRDDTPQPGRLQRGRLIASHIRPPGPKRGYFS
jgi:hypothetical protein